MQLVCSFDLVSIRSTALKLSSRGCQKWFRNMPSECSERKKVISISLSARQTQFLSSQDAAMHACHLGRCEHCLWTHCLEINWHAVGNHDVDNTGCHIRLCLLNIAHLQACAHCHSRFFKSTLQKHRTRHRWASLLRRWGLALAKACPDFCGGQAWLRRSSLSSAEVASGCCWGRPRLLWESASRLSDEQAWKWACKIRIVESTIELLQSKRACFDFGSLDSNCKATDAGNYDGTHFRNLFKKSFW